jgi:hypothetical protein
MREVLPRIYIRRPRPSCRRSSGVGCRERIEPWRPRWRESTGSRWRRTCLSFRVKPEESKLHFYLEVH